MRLGNVDMRVRSEIMTGKLEYQFCFLLAAVNIISEKAKTSKYEKNNKKQKYVFEARC